MRAIDQNNEIEYSMLDLPQGYLLQDYALTGLFSNGTILNIYNNIYNNGGDYVYEFNNIDSDTELKIKLEDIILRASPEGLDSGITATSKDLIVPTKLSYVLNGKLIEETIVPYSLYAEGNEVYVLFNPKISGDGWLDDYVLTGFDEVDKLSNYDGITIPLTRSKEPFLLKIPANLK